MKTGFVSFERSPGKQAAEKTGISYHLQLSAPICRSLLRGRRELSSLGEPNVFHCEILSSLLVNHGGLFVGKNGLRYGKIALSGIRRSSFYLLKLARRGLLHAKLSESQPSSARLVNSKCTSEGENPRLKTMKTPRPPAEGFGGQAIRADGRGQNVFFRFFAGDFDMLEGGHGPSAGPVLRSPPRSTPCRSGASLRNSNVRHWESGGDGSCRV
jgi:hypothetical protein